MGDEKIVDLGKRISWEQNVENLSRCAANELDAAINYTREAESSLKAFYKCLEEDSSVLAHYEAELGVTGIMNVIDAAFPDTPRATLEAMLHDD